MNASTILLTTLLNCPIVVLENPKLTPLSLTVTVTNLRNSHGMVCVSLFRRDGFPKVREKALQTKCSTIVNGTSTVTFVNLSMGEYAIAAYHDENSNEEMDSNFLGIPKEGVGASNNAKGHFGPPRYDDAKFKLSGNDQSIVIRITYL